MRPVFGSAVTASDVERLTSEQGEKAFVRLCATLVASATGELVGDFTVPNWTERINVADRGVDAEYTAPVNMLEAGGLVGPGRNVYQVKQRRLGTKPARPVVRELQRTVTGALKDLLSRDGNLPDRYILLVNVDLSRADRATLSQALRKDCPELNDRPLIIWGAAEIAAALNSHSHVRHAFFSEGVFCTLETASEELRARYEAVGWSNFVGYQEHLRVIRDFVTRTSDRLLLVTGLAYSGKTRTVIEALKEQEARVVWASDANAVTEDHFRALDSSSKTGVVLVDNCEAKHLGVLERWARSRTHLKTILISQRSASIPDIPFVRLEGLSYEACEALFDQAGKKVPHLGRDWISRLAGNNPGLILYALAAQRELPERPVLASERQKPRWVIGTLLRRTLLTNLLPDELDAMRVLAVLPQVGIEGDVKEELAAIVFVLNRDEVRVRQAIPDLKEKHLLIRRGRFVEVVPELLANDLAAEVFQASTEVVSRLWLRLSEPVRNRLLKRLLGLSDNPDVATLLDEVFSETGWFRTLDDLRDQARRFRMIAEARPRAARGALQRLLVDLDAPTLRVSVDDDLRREIVWSLEALALRADTLSGAADLLLRLAEAENERIGNNATGVFLDLFHWNHPEVSAPHGERIDFLFRAAGDPSPSRRTLIARAAGRAVLGWGMSFRLHQSDSFLPPEEPARLGTWGDVWQFHESILKILRGLTKDPDQEVVATAYHEVLESVREMLHLSVLQDGLHPLAEACFDTLFDLAGSEMSLRQRVELRGILDLIEDDLRRVMDEATRNKRLHKGAANARKRLDEVRTLLQDQSFANQLKRWVGPRGWGDDQSDVEAASRGALEPSAKHISDLAATACGNPKLLTAELMDWLMSNEAEHSPGFFMALGERDSAGAWMGPILDRLGTPEGTWAFGWYVAGVAIRDSRVAEDILDRLSLDKPDHVQGMLTAAFLLPATPGNVERLLNLVDRRLASATEVVGGIRYGWVRSLASQTFATLVQRLDDGTTEVAAGLVELLASWIHVSPGLSEELQEKAWLLLERSMESDNRQFAHRWDRVAKELAARQPQRFLELLQQLARRPAGLESAKTLAVLLDHATVWKKLRELNRSGVLLTLLRLEAQRERSPFWVSWCLMRFVDPDIDADVLARFAVEDGEAGALAVANVLDAERDGFWTIAAKLVEAFPNSEQLLGRLSSKVGTTGVVSGSFVPTWRHRLDKATSLLGHPHPKVSQWARHVVDWLEDYIRSGEKEDQEGFIWDYRISRRQLEGLLKERDSPDRLWAIRRILKRASTKDVLELLTLEDIKEGLSTVDLPEEERKKWEAYLGHWSHRG